MKLTLWQKDLIAVVGVIAVVAFCSLPLLIRGFIPTHDGEYHLIRFSEFFSMLQAGYWFPRWAPSLNSGYGIPLFNFHYPLPNYVGALFHGIGFSLVDSFKLTLASGYLTATVFCFFWLKNIFGRWAALVGAIVSSLVPYWFVDLYVRGSVGEILAIAWVMVTLTAIEYRKPFFVAVGCAGIILSHNILGMVFLPIIGLYILIQKPTMLPMMVVGVGLAAYFWIPALLEQSYVVGLNTVNFRDHFSQLSQLLIPAWGTGFSGPGVAFDEMSQQVGIVPLAVIFISLAVVIKAKQSQIRQIVILSLALFALVFFLMLQVSMPLWNLLIPLQYLQYPWRLLSLVILITAFCTSYISQKIHKWWVSVLIVVLALALVSSYSRPVVYPVRDDAYYLTKSEFTQGTSSMGNSFTTKWSPWKQTQLASPVMVATGSAVIEHMQVRPLAYTFAVRAMSQAELIAQILYYPGWKVSVDGSSQDINYHTDGTVRFEIAPGTHTVSIVFTETPLRLGADVISFLSLFWLLVLVILNRNRYAHRP